MREPTLGNLRVPCEHGEYVWHRGPADTKEPIWTCAGGRSLTPVEFDRIAREQGYVKVDTLRAFLLDARSRLGSFLAAIERRNDGT